MTNRYDDGFLFYLLHYLLILLLVRCRNKWLTSLVHKLLI